MSYGQFAIIAKLRGIMSPEHHALCADPGALRASLAVLLSWDFDSLVISHGTIIEGPEARAAVRQAFQTTAEAAESRGLLSRALRRTVARFA